MATAENFAIFGHDRLGDEQFDRTEDHQANDLRLAAQRLYGRGDENIGIEYDPQALHLAPCLIFLSRSPR